jgi:hypothetical protein
MRAAVGFELEAAREIAASHLGDELLAAEIMELAILETAEHLADLNPVGIEETRAILSRFFRSEVRRRQRADARFSFRFSSRGTSADVEYLSQDPLAKLALGYRLCQGTTSVVPKMVNSDSGFSRCGIANN